VVLEPRKKPGPRRALTETEILDAALALLDAGGPGAASIRRIAAVVGVAPNAVYTYFPEKAAVSRALVERLLGEVDHAAAGSGGGWRERIEALALDMRSRLIAHPGAVPLMMTSPMDGPHALALGERLFDLLADAGLKDDDAARGVYLVTVYVLGAVALEAADVPHVGALPPEAERIAAREATFAAVPPEAFPRTAAAAGIMATWVGTGQFVWGLRRLLAGLVGPDLD
jgi:TetR/AcrR family tetracycline transcriptional repressor